MIKANLRQFTFDYWVLLVLLLWLLFSNTIKFFLGKEIGALFPDFLCFIMLLSIIQKKYMLKNTIYDKWIFLLFIYVLFNQLYAVLTYSSIANSFIYYKIFYRGLIIYYFVRILLEKKEYAIFFFKKILLIFSIVLCADIIIEFILYNIFNIDLLSLPWVSYYNSIAKFEVFGNIEQNNIRIPTFYGLPHKASLLCASLVFVWFYFYKRYGNKTDLYMTYLTLVSALLANSKLQILILIFCFALLGIKRVSKFKLFLIFLIFLFLTLIFLDKLLLTLFDVKNLGSEKEFFIAWALLLQGDYSDLFKYSFIDLVPFNDYSIFSIHNISAYFLGVGMNDSSFYGTLYKIMRIESSLWLELLAQFGFIFIFFYYKSLMSLKAKIKNKDIFILWLSLFPFYLSVLHYWLLHKSGVMEIFVIIYAILVSVIIKDRHDIRDIKSN